MDYKPVLAWILDHPIETFLYVSAVPPILRIVIKAKKGTRVERWISRVESFVIDFAKILNTLGIQLPGKTSTVPAAAPVPVMTEVNARIDPYIPPALQRPEEVPSEAITADMAAEISTIRPPPPDPPRGVS